MGLDKLCPRGGLFTLRRRRNIVALENIAHGLIADRISQVLKRPLNTVIAPGSVLPGHADHQGFYLGVDSRPSRGLAMLGAVKLLCH